jgi:NADH pyrophosphatase NudC (nudix superfamily)
MGRIEVLKSKNLSEAKFNIVTAVNKIEQMSFERVLKEFGQYKSILIAEVDKELVIVDGNKYFKSLKKIGLKKINCINIGEISKEKYKLIRLLLNIHQKRLDYISIAELVENLVENKTTAATISNLTGITQRDAENYSNLLKFDWEDFKKKKNQIIQNNLI